MTTPLAGRSAVVTGASRGIGAVAVLCAVTQLADVNVEELRLRRS